MSRPLQHNPPPPPIEHLHILIPNRLIPRLHPRTQLPHPLPNRSRHAQLDLILEHVKHSKDKECDGGETTFAENAVLDAREETGCAVPGVFGVVGAESGFFVVAATEDAADERDK